MEQTIQQINISHEAALAAVVASVRRGQETGCCVAAAVVDGGGNLVAFLRAAGSCLHSADIAKDKAYSAVSFGMATAALFDLIKNSPALREGLAQRDRFIAFAGGFPITTNGQLIGGIGVSGGSEEQDCWCAQAGLAAIELN